MMGPYDWHFDRNHDGKLDFHERMQRMDFFDHLDKQGIYTDDDDDNDDDDDFDIDDDPDIDSDDDNIDRMLDMDDFGFDDGGDGDF